MQHLKLLKFSTKYLNNATFGTSLTFQMTVLEGLENSNFDKIQHVGPASKKMHLVKLDRVGPADKRPSTDHSILDGIGYRPSSL